MMLPNFHDLGAGVFCIDTAQQRPAMAACYLLVDGDQAAFVDAGVNDGVPGLLALLDHLGLQRDQVQYVIPTHVHLDHAGAAGSLIQSLPMATLVAHPRGIRHLINPARLEGGARAVYGDVDFERNFGRLIPVPTERALAADDGFRLELGERELLFLDTPGHAGHHFCIVDAASCGIFCGDTFGVSYPDTQTPAGPYIFPPTTPVQFDPAAWERSLDRLLDFAPRRMYLTHFGALENVEQRAEELRLRIRAFAALAEECLGESDLVAAIGQRLDAYVRTEMQSLGLTLNDADWRHLMVMDLGLNAQGLAVWLQRKMH